jgi:hypothetical protein
VLNIYARIQLHAVPDDDDDTAVDPILTIAL